MQLSQQQQLKGASARNARKAVPRAANVPVRAQGLAPQAVRRVPGRSAQHIVNLVTREKASVSEKVRSNNHGESCSMKYIAGRVTG